MHPSHISTSRETVRRPICSIEVGFVEIGGHQDRPFGLVALVDQRVELLEHPVGAFLGAEVVDVEEVDRGQLAEQLHVGVAVRAGVVALADPRQQFGQRVDRDRVLALQRHLRDEHAERRLAGPGVAEEPDAASGGEVLVELVEVGADRADRRPGLEVPRHVGDRWAVEGDALEARAGSPRRPRGWRSCAGDRRGSRRDGRRLRGRGSSRRPRRSRAGRPGLRNGSERAIAGIRTQAPPRRPLRRAAGLRRRAGRPAPPGRCSRRTSGSGRGRPGLWSRSGRSYAWR